MIAGGGDRKGPESIDSSPEQGNASGGRKHPSHKEGSASGESANGSPDEGGGGTALMALLLQELAAMRRPAPAGLPPGGLRLRDELGLDSLDRVEFVARVEQRFRLPLSDEEVDALGTLGEVVDLLVSRGVVAAIEASVVDGNRPEAPGAG